MELGHKVDLIFGARANVASGLKQIEDTFICGLGIWQQRNRALCRLFLC
jgi:hypothetical protein